jgi:hypothetical protein
LQDEIKKILQKQKEWQQSRKNLSWEDKVRLSLIMRKEKKDISTRSILRK